MEKTDERSVGGGFIERFRSSSIGFKLSLTFVLVVVFCSLPLSLLTISYVWDQLKHHVERSIEKSIVSQETELRNLVLTEDYWKAFTMIESLSQIPGIEEVLLVDSNYRIIASSKPEQNVAGTYFSYSSSYLRVPIESYSYPIGYILYKLDPKYIQDAILPLKLITAGITLLFILISTFLGLFVSLRINHRFRYIKDMIEQFKAGSTPSRKELWERDELTELADFLYRSLSGITQMLSNLKFARNFYEGLFNTLQEIVLILDGEGHVYFCNKAIENYGFSFEDLLGRRVCVLVADPKARSYIRKSIGEKRAYTGMVRLRSKDRRENYALLVLEPWEDTFVCTLKDITDLKASEEQMRRMEVFSMLGEMSAHLAHELKNAMQPIKLLSEVGEWEKEDVEVIRSSVDRIDKIINSFLHFTRPVDGRKEEFSSLEVVEKILKVYEPVMKRKGISLFLDVADFKLYTSKPALEIILSNLLKNAIEAVDGGGTIKLSMSRAGDKVLLSVEDNGHGIPETLLTKIFDPFFSTKKDGTGLGLSTVMRYVQFLDGRINVVSKEAEGTTFQLEVRA